MSSSAQARRCICICTGTCSTGTLMEDKVVHSLHALHMAQAATQAPPAAAAPAPAAYVGRIDDDVATLITNNTGLLPIQHPLQHRPQRLQQQLQVARLSCWWALHWRPASIRWVCS